MPSPAEKAVVVVSSGGEVKQEPPPATPPTPTAHNWTPLRLSSARTAASRPKPSLAPNDAAWDSSWNKPPSSAAPRACVTSPAPSRRPATPKGAATAKAHADTGQEGPSASPGSRTDPAQA